MNYGQAVLEIVDGFSEDEMSSMTKLMVMEKVLALIDKVVEDTIEEVLDDPYKHELVPMDSARDWVADNYRPFY